jgi:hypothetical protein
MDQHEDYGNETVGYPNPGGSLVTSSGGLRHRVSSTTGPSRQWRRRTHSLDKLTTHGGC